MLRRSHRAVPVPEHFAGNGNGDQSASEVPNGEEATVRAESLRVDLAGIAARIGGLTGSGATVAPTVDTASSELIDRLDRLAAMVEPGFANLEELFRSWPGIVEELTAWKVARNEELERSVARAEATAADVDQRNQRHLTDLTEHIDIRMAGLAKAINLVHSRLDNLNEIAEPLPAALERIRQGQGHLGAESVDARLAVTALEERLRHDADITTDEIFERLDRMQSVAGPGFEAIQELRRSWEGLLVQAKTSSADRGEELGRAVAASSARFETILADLEQRNQEHLSELTEQEAARMSGWSSEFDERLREIGEESTAKIIGRLDRFTAAPETVAALQDSLARLRREQDRLVAKVDAAVTSMAETAERFWQPAELAPGDGVDHMSQPAAGLEVAPAGTRVALDQSASDGQDQRGQMATLDLGLRVALAATEAMAGRQGDQVNQLKDAHSEVMESVLEALVQFGSQVDAGLLRATEELSASVFLMYEDSDERSHAMQDDLAKVLARVEVAEHQRGQQLVDLRQVVDGLNREVQLLRPAIDLRGVVDHALNDVALDRFAERVASLLSEEMRTRLDRSPVPAMEVGPPEIATYPTWPIMGTDPASSSG